MLLWRLRRRPQGTGWLFGVYLVLAGVERFLVEFVRAKEDRLVAGFTVAQLTALVIITVGAVLLSRFRASQVPPGPYLTGAAAPKQTAKRAAA